MLSSIRLAASRARRAVPLRACSRRAQAASVTLRYMRTAIVVRALAVEATVAQAQPNTTRKQQQALDGLLEAIKRGKFVIGFISDACPSGWEHYENAENRFLMGVPEQEHKANTTGGGTPAYGRPGRTTTGHGLLKADDGDLRVSPEVHFHDIPYVGILFCKPMA